MLIKIDTIFCPFSPHNGNKIKHTFQLFLNIFILPHTQFVNRNTHERCIARLKLFPRVEKIRSSNRFFLTTKRHFALTAITLLMHLYPLTTATAEQDRFGTLCICVPSSVSCSAREREREKRIKSSKFNTDTDLLVWIWCGCHHHRYRTVCTQLSQISRFFLLTLHLKCVFHVAVMVAVAKGYILHKSFFLSKESLSKLESQQSPLSIGIYP